MSLQYDPAIHSASKIAENRERRKLIRRGVIPSTRNSGPRELASISPTHERLNFVLDSLEQMVPPDVLDHPMAKFFMTFLRESKKDLRRLPEDFILGLSGPIGRAFTWVASGDNSLMADQHLFDNVPEYEDEPDEDDDNDEYDEEYEEENFPGGLEQLDEP